MMPLLHDDFMKNGISSASESGWSTSSAWIWRAVGWLGAIEEHGKLNLPGPCNETDEVNWAGHNHNFWLNIADEWTCPDLRWSSYDLKSENAGMVETARIKVVSTSGSSSRRAWSRMSLLKDLQKIRLVTLVNLDDVTFVRKSSESQLLRNYMGFIVAGENWQAVTEAAADLVENTEQTLQQARGVNSFVARKKTQARSFCWSWLDISSTETKIWKLLT